MLDLAYPDANGWTFLSISCLYNLATTFMTCDYKYVTKTSCRSRVWFIVTLIQRKERKSWRLPSSNLPWECCCSYTIYRMNPISLILHFILCHESVSISYLIVQRCNCYIENYFDCNFTFIRAGSIQKAVLTWTDGHVYVGT